MGCKMKTLKDYFEEEYEAYEEPAKNRRGFKIKYIYIGPLYGADKDTRELKVIKFRMFFFLLLSAVLVIVGAFQKRDINYYSLSAALATISMATLFFEVIGVFSFAFQRVVIKKQDFMQLEFLLKIAPVLNCALLIMAMLFGLRIDLLVALIYGASGVLSIGITHTYRMVRYEKRW